jgi:hypothetical protein
VTIEPELVKAIGIASAGILTAWQAKTASKVRDLEKRLAAVEEERDGLKKLFRLSVKHIRDWLAWAMQHAPGVLPPPLPAELRDEV